MLKQLRLAEFSCFKFKQKKYARKFRVQRTFSEKVVQQAFRQFFNIFWDFLIQNCGQDGNLLNCARAHRYRREVYRSNTGEREMHPCRVHEMINTEKILVLKFRSERYKVFLIIAENVNTVGFIFSKPGIESLSNSRRKCWTV